MGAVSSPSGADAALESQRTTAMSIRATIITGLATLVLSQAGFTASAGARDFVPRAESSGSAYRWIGGQWVKVPLHPFQPNTPTVTKTNYGLNSKVVPFATSVKMDATALKLSCAVCTYKMPPLTIRK
jgi:hypothetical protein